MKRNNMPHVMMLALVLLSTACSLSPEQQAAQAAARAEQQKQIALALAQRCDGETARLMGLAYGQWLGVAEADKLRLQTEFQQRYQSPAFQSCYQMAWENLRYRERVAYLEQREWQREMLWRNGYPFYSPYYSPFWW